MKIVILLSKFKQNFSACSAAWRYSLQCAILVTVWILTLHLTTAQPHPFAGGMGTETDPYQIATLAQLDSIRGDGSRNFLDSNFVLMNDLDFTGYAYADGDQGWRPIAYDIDNGKFDIESNHRGKEFTGNFNGRGYIIHHLKINRPDQDYIGLFSYMGRRAEIDSLGVEEVEITGRNHVGSLAGFTSGYITYSYATGQVTGNEYVGGLVGWARLSHIENSYAVSQVRGNKNVGGLVGSSTFSGIKNNYAASQVKGNKDVGGLVGHDLHNMIYTSNYWNTDISGLSRGVGSDDPEGVSGLTTAQMYDKAQFVGWDFTDVWLAPVSEIHFPLLRGVGGHQSKVSITAEAAMVSEGANATFTLTRTVTSGTLTVNVSVTQEGDYATNANDISSRTIDFTDGSGTTILTIGTEDDNVDEPNGTITATVELGTGYEVSTPASASIGIFDNDGIVDPEVRIEAEAATVPEGTDVVFTLTREGETTGTLSVNVSVTQEGDYIENTPPTTVNFADGSTTTLTIPTDDDNTDEADGSITVMVTSGVGYTLGDPFSAEVVVTDNDIVVPVVSIAADAALVTKGTTVTFTLTRTILSGSLTVNIEVTQEGEYVNANATGAQTVNFADGEATATLTIATINDGVDETGDGSVTVTIKAGSTNYTLGMAASAKVTVTDNDVTALEPRDGEDKQLYPNPVGNWLYVSTSEEEHYRLAVYTLSGRRERTYHINPRQGTISLDVSGLDSGMYVITLTDANGHSTHHRMVKE